MEGSSEDRWPSHRRRLADLNADEPDEGEFVPGHHYHPDMKSEKYYDDRDPSSDSDETISDSVPANYGDASPSCAAANTNGAATSSPVPADAAAVLACPFCWKEFRSHKAVCGHMKVHREQGMKKDWEAKRIVNVAAVGRRWGATSNRGCSGSRGRAASTNAESDQSMAVVVAAESKIVLQTKPLAFAPPNPSSVPTHTAAPKMPSVSVASAMANDDSFESSSPKPVHKDAMETAVARAANPPMEDAVHLHAAPPSPAASVHQQLVAPPPGDRRSSKGYTCKKCGMWFRTHQGLGGHMVGHKNRELAAAAVQDGAVPSRSNGKPEKVHVCKVCAAEFPGGVQLGGHMRKHWAGPPINKKPRFVVQPLPPPPRTTTVGVADLTLALPVKADEALPAPRPAVAGRVLLFGIDIGPEVQTPAAHDSHRRPPVGTVRGPTNFEA